LEENIITTNLRYISTKMGEGGRRDIVLQ
jgi:hypothetical protein